MQATGTVPALVVEDVVKSYAGPVVLNGVSIRVDPGTILGIIGPNGSGKTTLFGVISGAHAPSSGKVILNGTDVTPLSASARAMAGIGRTFQIPQTFAHMTVFENVLVAARFGAALPNHEAETTACEVLRTCGLHHRGDTIAGTLPLLDRKRLELARALATRPSVLLLDEIAGGLTDDEAAGMAKLVQTFARSGVAIIWIEHLVHVLTNTADQLAVLGEGQIIAHGDPQQTMQMPKVRQIYLGMEPDTHDIDN
ncbi:ABC transporter ATP-binding protein [Rhizobium bangladeshense]|uniref:ABC transporter ATP-binding protein n=1 Tax=Rhizobium bangladeshense TaxID=1138189 RepID=UPI001C8355AD|nr:ABC transporter ATP-binding protein [Rhizobium bangladeshense]MBX4871027.1 ABC transporter ATP-binding protein [Rhizobium bangladeshense]MBX4871327.1 ABC transporter ATP-binding protein [Rhizobium bangladeshense]MBX4887591.1 ABC transporter ATP-binding protein [Rhizobium bangladeshense]